MDIKNRTVKQLQVYQYIYDRVGSGTVFIPYKEIADEIGITRQGVAYAVTVLEKNGFIKKTPSGLRIAR